MLCVNAHEEVDQDEAARPTGQHRDALVDYTRAHGHVQRVFKRCISTGGADHVSARTRLNAKGEVAAILLPLLSKDTWCPMEAVVQTAMMRKRLSYQVILAELKQLRLRGIIERQGKKRSYEFRLVQEMQR